MNTSEVLNKAADLIEERGWEQRGTCNSSYASIAEVHTGYCLEGAISAAVGHEFYDMDEVQNCAAHIAVRAYLDDRKPWVWNNRLGRTQEQVIETLRAAALIEAAKENPDTAKESAAVQVPPEVVA